MRLLHKLMHAHTHKLEKSKQIVYSGLFSISQDFSQGGLVGAPAYAVSAIKNMNLPRIPKK